jgi:hypothetical protein
MDAQEQQHALKGRQKLEEVRRKKAAAAAAGSGQVLTTPFFWFLPDQIMPRTLLGHIHIGPLIWLLVFDT